MPSKITLVLIFVLLAAGLLAQSMPFIPVTGGDMVVVAEDIPELSEFIAGVKNGQPDQLVGIYAAGALAQPIVQQPVTDPAFVSRQPGEVTQFGLASNYGTIGLLAHNYLAGADFFELAAGQLIVLVYGDGRLAYYQVQSVQQYQALQPKSPYSDYINLQTGQQLTTADTFAQIYQPGGRVVLQTCIAANGEDSWGRLFVVAVPVTPPTPIEMVRDGSSMVMAGLSALNF